MADRRRRGRQGRCYVRARDQAAHAVLRADGSPDVLRGRPCAHRERELDGRRFAPFGRKAGNRAQVSHCLQAPASGCLQAASVAARRRSMGQPRNGALKKLANRWCRKVACRGTQAWSIFRRQGWAILRAPRHPRGSGSGRRRPDTRAPQHRQTPTDT